jgi:hypothetical protein
MRAGSQDDGPTRDPGGRPSGRISNDIISVASEHNQQSIILHTSIELFAELATNMLKGERAGGNCINYTNVAY